MSNKSIKIPDRLYVGLLQRPNKIPRAAITPYGSDRSAKNRMRNIDQLVSSSYRNNTKLGTTILENKPLNGFKFTSCAYNNSKNNFWYVEDPRGFEVEISSENLNRLLTSGLVDNGELLFPCVWARDGADNVLLSTTSEEYIIAIDNTAVSKGKASWKDVKLGDTVLLRNNTQGRWLGKFYLVLNYGYGKTDSKLSANEYIVRDKPYHIFHVPESGKNYTSAIYIISTPQLSKIISSDSITKTEAEILVNEYIQDVNCEHNSNLYRKIIAASFDMPKKDQFKLLKEELNPANQDELRELVGNNYVASIPNVYVETSGLFGKVRNNPYYVRHIAHDSFYIIEYSLPHIDKAELRRVYIENTNYRNDGQYSENHVNYNYNKNDKFYNLKLCLKTSLNNEINLYIN